MRWFCNVTHLVSGRAQIGTCPWSLAPFPLRQIPQLIERECACEGIQLMGYEWENHFCIQGAWPILKLEMSTEVMTVWNGSERKTMAVSETTRTTVCQWLIGIRISHFNEQILNRLKEKMNSTKHVWHPRTCQNPVRNVASGALDREAGWQGEDIKGHGLFRDWFLKARKEMMVMTTFGISLCVCVYGVGGWSTIII